MKHYHTFPLLFLGVDGDRDSGVVENEGEPLLNGKGVDGDRDSGQGSPGESVTPAGSEEELPEATELLQLEDLNVKRRREQARERNPKEEPQHRSGGPEEPEGEGVVENEGELLPNGKGVDGDRDSVVVESET